MPQIDNWEVAESEMVFMLEASLFLLSNALTNFNPILNHQLVLRAKATSGEFLQRISQKHNVLKFVTISVRGLVKFGSVWKEAWRTISVVTRSNQIKRPSSLLILDQVKGTLLKGFLARNSTAAWMSLLSAGHCVSMFGSSEARRTAMLSSAAAVVKYPETLWAPEKGFKFGPGQPHG